MTRPAPAPCTQCSMYAEAGNFCASLTAAELKAMNARSCLVTIKRDETIPREVLQHHPVMAVSSGVLSVQQLLHDGRRTIAAIMMRGDILDLRHTTAKQLGTLVALSKVQLCRLSPAVFDQSIAINPSAREMALRNITNQAYRAISHASDLAKKQALEKLASFVVECRDRCPEELPLDDVHIPIRRGDLADYLGMQPETVSRSFKELEERGVVQVLDLSHLRVRDAEALRRIAGGDRSVRGSAPFAKAGFSILVADV